jgi:DNA-nicking Smr family endonuclease
MMRHDGRPRRRKLSDDERALWRAVTRSVAPLKRMRAQVDASDGDRAEHAAGPYPAAPPGAGASRRAARTGPPGALDRRIRKRLARGGEPIDICLDLHGRTQSEAHAALRRFLRDAQADGARFALIITGKGVRTDPGSGERGVLRRQVPLWLGLPEFAPYVAAFAEADLAHGGSGALYVRIRRARTAG